MRLSIGDLNNGIAGHLNRMNELGELVRITNNKTKRDRGVLIPSELWDEIEQLPTVRRKLREYAATKQDSVSDAA